MQMRTYRRKLSNISLPILINRNRLPQFRYTRIHNCARAPRDLLDIRDIGLEVPLIIKILVNVFANRFWASLPVKHRPRIFDTLDQVGEELPGNETVGKAISGVAGIDVNVFVRPGLVVGVCM